MKYLIVAGMVATLSIGATDARANSVTELPAVIDGMSDFTAIHTDDDFLTRLLCRNQDEKRQGL